MKLILLMRRLGLRKLSRYFNEDFLEQYSSLSGSNITEKIVSQLLFNKKGYSILKDKQFRNEIYNLLQPQEKEILGENIDFSWSRKSKKAIEFLEILDVPLEECFPSSELPDNRDSSVYCGDYSLFSHQLTVKYQIFQAFSNNENRFLIHMPTGSGKTRTTIDSIFDFYKYQKLNKGMIVWLAHTQELCEQAYDTAVKIWKQKGDTSINIIKLWGNSTFGDLNKSDGVIIGSLQKMYAMLNSKKNTDFTVVNHISRNACLLVVDEAHKSMAPTYNSIIKWITSDSCPLIGLTATPGRSWDIEENKRMVNFFDGNRITILGDNNQDIENPIKYLQENGYLSKINRFKIPIDIDFDLNEQEKLYLERFMEFSSGFLNRLGKNTARNAIVFHEIVKLCVDDMKSIVFTTSIEQGYLLSTLLNEKGFSSQMIDGNTPTNLRSDSIQKFKSGELDVILNYNILSTGFDSPNIDAIVIARPTTSIVLYNQMLGRGIRGEKVGGKKECILIDIVDNLNSLPDEVEAFNYFNSYWE